MNAEVIDIGLYIKVPYDVVISRLSNRAFRVWSLIAADASPENPIASVRQSTLAQKLGCSTDTIGRAIAELTQHGLLCEAGKWNQGRCKIYSVTWNPSIEKDEEIPKESSKRVSELDDLLATYGEVWARAYECFDGVSGRPSLRECVDEALSNASRAKGASLKTFIDGWLHISSQRWRASEVRVRENPPTPFQKGGQETEDASAWIIAQIKSDNERQRRKESLEAKRKASFSGHAISTISEPRVEKPICRENYPISWEFYKIQLSQSRRNIAA